MPAAVPLPDGTTWTDDQGNLWTANGDDVTIVPGDLGGTVVVVQTA